MENGEDFWLRFFDGSSWNTVQTWTSGTDIENNTFYNATVTITPAQYNFAINSGFRFQNDASGNILFPYLKLLPKKHILDNQNLQHHPIA